MERGGGKQVRKLDERIEFLETVGLPVQREANGGKLAEFEDFIAAGRVFRDEMVDVIHGDLDARYVDRRSMNDWSLTAAKMQRGTQATVARRRLSNG